MIEASRLRWPVFVVLSAALVAAAILGLLQVRPEGSPAAGSVRALPFVNATLNATSGILLVVGFVCIRLKIVRAHVTCMFLALAATGLFLVSYVVYHFHVGSVAFQGSGAVRRVYLLLLVSHATLAALVVPLAATVLYRAARGQFDRHRKIARWTLPVWVYVSVSGVLIYLMLYVWYPAP